ncbi:MAG: GntR family transcriptional regulator [Firmicutes bacterium]|nr:GntR family transcriptional regulator [Bacillota bacterium]
MNTGSRQLYTEQIYQALRNDIINLVITPGQKLNIRELQNHFNVSGSPVREAISRLYQEGIVEYIPNTGAKVIEFKPKDILELEELHTLLDCDALELSIQHEDFATIAAELVKLIDAQKQGDLTAANKFHGTFYLHSHNSRLLKIWDHLGAQAGLVRSLYAQSFQKNKLGDIGLEDHIDIYNAVLAGNLQQAKAAIRTHHMNALHFLLRM